MSNPVIKLLEQLLESARAEDAPTPEPPPEYLSVEDFAARLAITAKAVRAMVKDGMPCLRPRPRTWRIPVTRAEAWIAEQTRPADAALVEARRRATLDAHRGDVH